MTEADFIAWAYKAGWSGVALLFSYSVYLGVKHMAPVWAERYKAQTHRVATQRNNGAEEDRPIRERVRALEVRMEDVKADIREIKNTQEALRNLVEEKADEIRDKLQESQDRIVNILERRKEPRG